MSIRKKVITFLSFLVLLSGLAPLSGSVLAIGNTADVPSRHIENSFVVGGGEFASVIEKNSFAFTGIASRWSEGLENTQVYLRSGKSEEGLGKWMLVSEEDDKRDDATGFIFGSVFNSRQDRYFQYKVIFGSSSIGKDFKISLDVFDTSSQVGATKISADNSGLGPKIISRAEWGANENYMTWKNEYAEVKAIVLHHTAGEEGALVSNQMSVVRNLYYGHAVSNGWGDIGYNYVIDTNGNIYEGRSGGNGVIGGHTLGYNAGTVGIALIGDYGVRTMNPEQYQSLNSLIAYLNFINRSDPTGQTYLKNKTIPVVVGHRDLNATQCPGASIYERLSDIRLKAKDKLSEYPARQYSAQFVSTEGASQIYGGDTTTVKVNLKNTGNAYWLGDGDHKVNITASGGNLAADLPGPFRGVAPGEIASLNLNLTAPSSNGSVNQMLQAKIDGANINGGSFNLSTNIVTPEYRAKLSGQSPSLSLQSGKQVTAWIEFKNAGSKAWNSGDGFRLTTKNGNDSQLFSSGDWENKKSAGGFDSYPVNVGGTERISFLVTAPSTAGQYKEDFVLQADNKTLGAANELAFSLSVTVTGSGAQLTNVTTDQKVYSQNISAYTYSIVNQSSYLTISPGEKKSVSLEIKNTGITNWYKDIVHLATTSPRDRSSDFADSSWVSGNRISMRQDKVVPGQSATFSFTITAPNQPGNHKEYFGFVADGIGWMRDIGLFWSFDVTAPSASGAVAPSNASAESFGYVSQSPYISLTPGQSQQVWLEVKNTGNTIWSKSGSTPIRLATSNPRDRISPFINSNRVLMDDGTVNPGQNTRFTFNITAPVTAGVYKEYFTLVHDGVAWMDDIGIYWQITVTKAQDVNATPSNGTPNAQLISVPAGVQTVKVSASGPFIVVNGSEAKLAEGGNGDSVTAYYSGGKHFFKVNNGNVIEAPGWVRIVPWAPQTILTVDSYTDRPAWNQSLNDNKFKGAIEVRYSAKNKKFWVIDDLNIEDYLAGVSEPLEAGPYEYIKAAVIAERSYVYYHLSRGGRWPDDFITLKNSRNGNGDDQIYQGYGFTSRSTNIPRAVADTAGQVVTYAGNPVLTPYYTQSDGRTRSISEVWGSPQSSYPWLVSVPDPWSAGQPMLGHGVGMSGRGARGMGAEGKPYKDILKYFYTGTDIGKIDTNRNIRIGIYSIDM